MIPPKTSKTMDEVPALPQRSTLRMSKVLDENFTMNKINSRSTPHDVYMSSEEDASSSADDFSEYDFSDEEDTGYISNSEEPQKSPVRRKSQEDTARIVSVVFSGRPSIIDVSTSRRPSSLHSIQGRPRTSIASTPESFACPRRPSTSATSIAPNFIHPPRSSSMKVPAVSHKVSKNRPLFLNTDPFSDSCKGELHEEEDHVPKLPKSPGAVLKSMSRTLSIVKKRSRPVLHNSPPVTNTEYSLSNSTLSLQQSQTPQLSHAMSEELSTPEQSNDLSLHSEPCSSKSNPKIPISPQPRTASTGAVKGFLAMARRRSIHVRSSARV